MDHTTIRKNIIRGLLNLPFNSVVIKYDYFLQWEVDYEANLEQITSFLALDDGRMAFGLSTGYIIIWNVTTKNEDMVFSRHNSGVSYIRQLDSNRIVTSSDDTTLRIWNLETGETENILQGHTVFISGLEILPDNRIVSSEGFNGSGNTIIIWSGTNYSDRTFLNGHQNSITDIVLFGNKIVSASEDRTIKVWDSETGELENSIDTEDYVRKILVLPNNRIAFYSGFISEGQFKIITLNNKEIITNYVSGDVISNMIFENNELYLVYRDPEDELYKIKILDVNTYQEREIDVSSQGSFRLFGLPSGDVIINSLERRFNSRIGGSPVTNTTYIFDGDNLRIVNNRYMTNKFYISKFGKVISQYYESKPFGGGSISYFYLWR